MGTQVQLGDISVDVVRKDIKNVHLSVLPPYGRVRISAPLRMSMDTIRVFAIAKLPWIKQQRRKLENQPRETPREYVDRESHYLWGKRYLLFVIEDERRPSVELKHTRMLLRVRPGADVMRRQAIVEEWYRNQIREVLPALIAKWEKTLGVEARRYSVRRMKTKWGSCNHQAGTVLLNTELAKKPRECLEYIIVHELAHLIERHHNERFTAIMDKHLPRWRVTRDVLNAAPLSHETWSY